MWQVIECESNGPRESGDSAKTGRIQDFRDDKQNLIGFDYSRLWGAVRTHKAYPSRLLQLVEACLAYHPEDRPSIKTLERGISHEIERFDVFYDTEVDIDQDQGAAYVDYPKPTNYLEDSDKAGVANWDYPMCSEVYEYIKHCKDGARFGLGDILPAERPEEEPAEELGEKELGKKELGDKDEETEHAEESNNDSRDGRSFKVRKSI
jgi:hypothetical protein